MDSDSGLVIAVTANDNDTTYRGEVGDSDFVGTPVSGLIRLIGLDDPGYDRRLAWLRKWIVAETVVRYNHGDLRVITQVDRPFALLVLHGDEPPRMARIIREWREVFPGKLLVAFLPAVTAQVRTVLLRSGCDFVFEFDDTGPVLSAVLGNALRRQAGAHGAVGLSLGSLDLAKRLSAAEMIILEALFENTGRVVGYDRILQRLGKPQTAGTIKCLQVQMRQLRRKIRSGAIISNAKALGYRAEFPVAAPC